MREDGLAGGCHKAYWKHAIWLMAGITLIALFTINTCSIKQVEVEHIIISVAFSLVFSFGFTKLLRNVESNGGSNAMRAFLLYATVRLLSAIALIGAYMAFTGLRGRQMLPFVLLFSIYFFLLDALDAFYMVRVTKAQLKGE